MKPRIACKRCGLPAEAPIHTGGHPTRCHPFASAASAPTAILPVCAVAMGCLCAGHARGNSAADPCDTSEVPQRLSVVARAVIYDITRAELSQRRREKLARKRGR